ncbi:hypothetical protein, partial [Streptomyces sp. NPDC058394]|uniref:hypothetical protein n=1 Tax=Streptomyces sp. NPDC058394 TaxID=3346477 RepID=UPI0036578727
MLTPANICFSGSCRIRDSGIPRNRTRRNLKLLLRHPRLARLTGRRRRNPALTVSVQPRHKPPPLRYP